MTELIDPRVASGFRDLPPALMIHRERLLERLRATFRLYGFVPIDTPTLERREVLYSKGAASDEVTRQIFEVLNRGAEAEAGELALRFDLTVPLARFMARHVDDLGVPFKRYHIGLVFRGERPQRGRYREFYQCDFDTVGTTSSLADAETAQVIAAGMHALGIDRFTLRLNHRKLLNGFLGLHGLRQHSGHVLRALDKLGKIGPDGVLHELKYGSAAGDAAVARPQVLTDAQAAEVMHFVELCQRLHALPPREALGQLGDLQASPEAAEGLANLRQVCDLLDAAGVPAERLVIDPALARGLDYYTGIIYETTVDGSETYGSVCSGGRYDDLASLFIDRRLPGVGASFGLDRLVQLMADAGWLEMRAAAAPVLVVQFQEADRAEYVRIAAALRGGGIGAEVYPDAVKLRDQLGYASNRGYRLALIAGPDELQQRAFSLRDLATRQQQKNVPLDRLVAAVRAALDQPAPAS